MVFRAGELAGANGRFCCWECGERVELEADEALEPCVCGGNEWIRLRNEPSQSQAA